MLLVISFLCFKVMFPSIEKDQECNQKINKILDFQEKTKESNSLQRKKINFIFKEQLRKKRLNKFRSNIISLLNYDYLYDSVLFHVGYVLNEKIMDTSVDESLASTFHERCDNKGPTLILIKDTNDNIFGGVNTINWTNSGGCVVDENAILFSLSLQQIVLLDNKKSSSVCYFKNEGPIFGFGKDLFVSDDCTNNTNSYSNLKNSYGSLNSQITPYLFVGGKNKNFQVKYYEVYTLIKEDY